MLFQSPNRFMTPEIQSQRLYGEHRKVGFTAPGYFTFVPFVSFIKNI
jgi:hypothetical protein